MSLDEYRAKRSPERTTEPFGGPGAPRPHLFVVQKHGARRLHYDFRLELDGVLRSWAVPKGPCFDPAEKRLAVEVEDHPLEYADFEGIIPPGNYGAGAVILWDRGRWVPLEDPAEGFRKGKLLFELRGYKLRGVWTLIRLKKSPKDWLLIKERDGHAAPRGAGEVEAQESVLSGLTLEEVRDGSSRVASIRSELERLGAHPRRLRATDAAPMLAETREQPFSDPAWLFELKYDGYRVIAAREGGRGRLIYRRGRDATVVFPDVTRALACLPADGLVMDGEIVVCDEQGIPSFQRLQKRALLSRAPDVERAAVELPATLFLFDLLGFEDFDLRDLPLTRRKELLRRIVPASGPLRYVDHIEADGLAVFEEVRRMGLEGVVAKRSDSRYRAGRSADWLKIRVERTADFVVVGFSAPGGSRAGFGALHLAAYEADQLVYAGRVGTGFSEEELRRVGRWLRERVRPTPACAGPLPKDAGDVWVKPELVVEVRFRERTDDGLLRQPAFLRFREDKRPEECPMPPRTGRQEPEAVTAAPEPSRQEPAAPSERKVAFTNLDKVFWPEEGYTKGDLIDYYRAVSPWLLPYLRDRPLVLTRFPDGIHGKSFFQKDAPEWTPAWIRTERIWGGEGEREIQYFIGDDVESLLHVANMGTIPLHVWSSRVAALERPDWCILDLDPKGAPFADVVALARAIHELCSEMELPSFAKTSGGTGLHVLVPLGAQCSHAQSRALGELIATVIAGEHRDIATVARAIPARKGRVYVDFLQNGHGKTIAGPLSARPVPGARVSMPLAWREVNARLDPSRFTIKTAVSRLERMKSEPMRQVLELRPDLEVALEKLGERLKGGAKRG